MAYFWRCPDCGTLLTFGDDEAPEHDEEDCIATASSQQSK